MTRRRWGIAVACAAGCWGAIACGSSPERVGVGKHALMPTTFDLPDHDDHKIKTGFLVPGSGEPAPGQQVGTCFFTRLKGPFTGEPPYDDSKNNPNLDAFASILPDESNELVFEISPNGMQGSVGCVALADFQNAGKDRKSTRLNSSH